MPDDARQADALRVLVSGADSAGGALVDAQRYLGKHRSTTETAQRAAVVVRTLPGLVVRWASAANAVGTGRIDAVGRDSVTWTPPGGSPGDPVRIPVGAVAIATGSDASSAVRLERMTSQPLAGFAEVEISPVIGGAFGMSDLDQDAEDRYRSVFLYNASPYAITDLRFGLTSLGSSFVSNATQLGASGSGSVEGAALSTAGWPSSGYAIITSAGPTYEVVYYESTTGGGITVPASGRGRFGTTPKAGGSSDTVEAISPIRLALETPGGSGAIQEIADETTAPTSLSWSFALMGSEALTHARLEPGESLGLWIHRSIPAGASASALSENAFTVSFKGA